MTYLLDAGALIAVERGDRALAARVVDTRRVGETVITHGGVVGQVWRGSPRQATLARLLSVVRVVALDDHLGRRAGRLLAASGGSDVVDAAQVSRAGHGDTILTSDVDDVAILVAAACVDVDVVHV